MDGQTVDTTVTTTATPDGAVVQQPDNGDGGQQLPVSITQAQLDALINKAFAKGATAATRKDSVSEPPIKAADEPAVDVAAITRERDALRAENEKTKIDTEITLQAVSLGFTDPSDAVALANRALITRGSDGALSGVKEALEDLKAAKPHLLKPNNAPPAMGGVNHGRTGPPVENIGAKLGKIARERDEQARKAQESITRK